MRPKHDGTFFLTWTSQWVVKRVRGERNVRYWRYSFFVIHRQIASWQQIRHLWKAQQMAREESIRKRREMVVKMVKPFLSWGYSQPLLLKLVHVWPLILQARAGNLLSLIVLGTMIRFWAGLDMTWLLSPIHQQELGVYWRYQVRFLYTIFFFVSMAWWQI